jgi:23S rRNA (adenine2503-C2)-methyltransferase
MAVDEIPAVSLLTLSRAELVSLAQELGQPAYRGGQLFAWLYGKGVRTFEGMTDLPRLFRATLAERFALDSLPLVHRVQARDGTVKCLFALPSGRQVEAVLIPDFDEDGDAQRLTVCVSSQVGCAMGCAFCATGQMGFRENLTAGAIFDQVWHLNTIAETEFGRRITNIVFMGMGEPLLNYGQVLNAIEGLTHEEGLGLSPRRITVSTVGIARRIQQLADDGARFNLAVSLHAPVDAKRSEIMPVNRNERTDLKALREAIRYYTEKTGRPVTYEYCMFEEFNDTEEDARQLVRVARWAPSKVTLLLYNPVESLPFRRTEDEQLNRFIRVLVASRVTVTVRRSRGQDIDAACGQLALRHATPTAA